MVARLLNSDLVCDTHAFYSVLFLKSENMTINSTNGLEQLKTEGAALVIFGGEHCGVCQSIKPKIEQLLEAQFPDVDLVYVDCEASPEICAQHGVFSLPVIKVFIQGQVYLEMARHFSLTELTLQLGRIYQLWKSSE